MGLTIIDTSILVDTLRGVPEARQVITAAAAAERQVAASVVTKVELRSGMRANEKRATRALLDAMMWVAIGDAIAEQAGAYARTYRRSHQGIGVVDFLIAATAAHLDATLWTHNVRHYPMFPDLAPPY